MDGEFHRLYSESIQRASDRYINWRNKTLHNTINFTWIEKDDRYDFIVGIAFDEKPIGTGSWIRPNVVITSATVAETPLRSENRPDRLSVTTIHEYWNGRRTYPVICYTVINRHQPWVKHGNSQRNSVQHSPTHDVLMLTVESFVLAYPAVPLKQAGNRLPFIIKAAPPNFSIYTQGWTYAGFGQTDMQHVETNLDLEMEQHEDHVLVDCDEYIPRRWGRFLCISNVNNITGISSGAPLIQNEFLVGIGCFEMTRGNESILVFTDVRAYISVFEYCTPTIIDTATVSLEWYNFTTGDAVDDVHRHYNKGVIALARGIHEEFLRRASTRWPPRIQKIIDFVDRGGKLPMYFEDDAYG